MSAVGTTSQMAENGDGGVKRMRCPFHGCQRVYTETKALETHISDHEISAQSVAGKALLCSAVGCSGTFPNMQKLMEHLRHHHKPNIFFLCESCRTKLRSYRGLLTHLHTCSKVPRGKTKLTEPTAALPAAVSNPNNTPLAMDQDPPQLVRNQIPNPDASIPAAVTQPDSASPLPAGLPLLSNLETSPPPLASQQFVEAAPQSQEASAVAPEAPDSQSPHQFQNRSPEAPHPATGPASHSPPGSSAIWRKNQGLACSRRILWEHTKGRYTCVQCGYSVTNRKEMTQHINTQHSSNKLAEEPGVSASNV